MDSLERSMISSKTVKKNKIPLIKIVLVGESEVGKTTIINTFMV